MVFSSGEHSPRPTFLPMGERAIDPDPGFGKTNKRFVRRLGGDVVPMSAGRGVDDGMSRQVINHHGRDRPAPGFEHGS